MENSFKKIYLNMLYEQVGIISYDSEKWERCLKNAICFDPNGNLINEDRNLPIDVPESLMTFCYSNQSRLIQFSEVKPLLKASKHFRNVKKDYERKLWFSIFDFNDDTDIRSFHYRFFHMTDEEELADSVEMFKANATGKGGLYIEFDDVDICLVNEHYSVIQMTMHHELSHYIQKVCNVRVLMKEVTATNEVSKLKDIRLTLDDFNYYVSKNEFFVHINELIVGLKKTYDRYYSKLTKFTFFYDVVMGTIMNEDSSRILQSDFVQKYIRANDREYAALAMLIASYYLNVKFQKIRDITYESFRK